MEQGTTLADELAASASIDELFSLDPEKLSDEHILSIVTTLRAKRELWEAEENSARKDGRRAKTSKGTKKLTLDELDIDLEDL